MRILHTKAIAQSFWKSALTFGTGDVAGSASAARNCCQNQYRPISYSATADLQLSIDASKLHNGCLIRALFCTDSNRHNILVTVVHNMLQCRRETARCDAISNHFESILAGLTRRCGEAVGAGALYSICINKREFFEIPRRVFLQHYTSLFLYPKPVDVF